MLVTESDYKMLFDISEKLWEYNQTVVDRLWIARERCELWDADPDEFNMPSFYPDALVKEVKVITEWDKFTQIVKTIREWNWEAFEEYADAIEWARMRGYTLPYPPNQRKENE